MRTRRYGILAFAVFLVVVSFIISGSSNTVTGWSIEIVALLLTILAYWTVAGRIERRGIRADPSRDTSWPKGDFSVDLVSSGDDRIQMIKTIHEVSGVKLRAAKALVDSPPSQVIAHIDQSSAQDIAGRLEKSGGSARIGRS